MIDTVYGSVVKKLSLGTRCSQFTLYHILLVEASFLQEVTSWRTEAVARKCSIKKCS